MMICRLTNSCRTQICCQNRRFIDITHLPLIFNQPLNARDIRAINFEFPIKRAILLFNIEFSFLISAVTLMEKAARRRLRDDGWKSLSLLFFCFWVNESREIRIFLISSSDRNRDASIFHSPQLSSLAFSEAGE